VGASAFGSWVAAKIERLELGSVRHCGFGTSAPMDSGRGREFTIPDEGID
jgi:hypothetical protein